MLIHSNLPGLQQQDSNILLEDFNFSMGVEKISFFDFTSKFMSIMYKLIFNKEIPRVSEDMKNKLQLSSEPTED